MAQVRTRKRGKTYSYIFEAGKADGKRKVVEKGGFETQQEAYNAGIAAYNDWLHGNIGITSDKITLKDFMTNWLEKVVVLSVKLSTFEYYVYIHEHYISPHLGSKKVQDLTPAIVDKFMRELAIQGFSRNTLSAVHSLLSYALDYAVYPAQIIMSNPAKYIKVSKKAPDKIVERTIISREKFNALMTKYPFGTAMYIPLLLLYHTGMRISEVCGLTWDNVDLNKGIIKVCQQIVYINKTKGLYFTTPKTKTSVREILIDRLLVSELKRWKSKQIEDESEVGDEYIYVYRDKEGKVIRQSQNFPMNVEKVDLVCTHKGGQLVLRNYVEIKLQKENLNAHSFRHTHATVLIENGATPKGVAGRLGHSNAVITQNLYTHNTEKLSADTAYIFEKVLQTIT